MNYYKESLKFHRKNRGKIELKSKMNIKGKDDLSIAYTPGVAEPCREIYKNPEKVYEYTPKGNMVAVISDGSAVLGLGNIGCLASIPVMEGKAMLFKEFAGIDAFPITLDTNNIEEIVNTIKVISPSFGGINLEDISAPKCIEIERKLKEKLDIPVFHDDQHGTAIVVLAGLINSLKLINKNIEDIKIVVNGIGAAGGAIIRLLIKMGAKNIVPCDINGILAEEQELDFNKKEILELTNPNKERGDLARALQNADVFIGVSAANIVDEVMIKSMRDSPIVFAMANPEPEIMPDIAKRAGVRVIATGRSDFPNQINNVLAFPGIFKGALEIRAKEITDDMKIKAAYAIAGIAMEDGITEEYIIPKPLDKRVVDKVSKAVKDSLKEV